MEQGQGVRGPGLEDRLRTMILTNSNDPEPQVENAPNSSSPPQPRKRLNQAQRRQMSAQLNIAIDPRAQPPDPVRPQQALRGFAPQPGPPAGHQPAQRLGHQVGHQAGRQPVPYGNGGRYGNQRPQSGPQPTAYHHQQTGPRAHQPNPPHTGNQIPVQHQGHAQPRHHPSRSYHGPGPQHLDRNTWRQPLNSGPNPGSAHHTPQGSFDGPVPRNSRGGALWNPGRQPQIRPEQLKAQTDMLEGLCATIIANAQIEYDDIVKNETFRQKIEALAQAVITQYEQSQNGFYDFPPQSVQLRCFGSLASGFATKAADMDLGLLSPLSRLQPDAPGSPIPRLIEKAFLEVGLAARLLSKTRVPIIKVCEKPPKSLYDDLVEEHLKRERDMSDKGEGEKINDPELDLAEDDEHEADEPAGGHASAVDEKQQKQQKGQKDDMQNQPKKERHDEEGNQDDNGTEKKEFKLYQALNQTLNSYYGTTKGYLRSLGGRDLTNSTINHFSPADFQKLNQVCLAFVEGLEDRQLRDRLFSYKSLDRYDLEYRPDQPRTLQGVYTQVEGEQMVMMWESRQITEKDADKEARGQICVNRWKTLQDHPNCSADPLGYDRDLKRAADQLRGLPSIQLMLLSQGQYESTAQYCARAKELVEELVGNDTADERREAITLISRRYIDGIKDESIREAVKEYAESVGYSNFHAIGKRHMSYHLAHDLEHCLGRNLYPKDTEDKISSYIAFLRGPIVRSSVEPFECGFETPLSPDLIETISQIRSIGDPSTMGPNQPRDPYRDRFEFPKSGVGIQCDINFSAHLAMHNTHLLRCYSSCDPRVRPMVLFVKHWAKVRGINSPYRGTLSSYGYVLMVLHYLINVVKPFVCPNLQQLAPPLPPDLTPEQLNDVAFCKGKNVHFWRDDQEIQRLAAMGMINQNRDSIGHLLRGFFEYYAQNGSLSTLPGRGFDWGRDVISLRTQGGILSKQEKGWTGAKTVLESTPGVPSTVAPSAQQPQQPQQQQQPAAPLAGGAPLGMAPPPGLAPPPGFPAHSPLPAPAPPAPTTEEPTPTGPSTEQVQQPKPDVELKEVRYRYLFAIEDPFELDHNVARTVTHSGIVAIRDEFRRAWRIIRNAGRLQVQGQGLQIGGREVPVPEEENLLEDVLEAGKKKQREEFDELLDGLHGRVWRGEVVGEARKEEGCGGGGGGGGDA
ncbi:hypothetical protein GE21DRAFT_6159 [Neurospora crassa]|uniref:polynucleotide adenylyltransferase n=2 Tax=Neurospora crassa TaxID=5141 RepID=V5IP66_NEUCR|nr:hypothetical protein NCU04364 [Neurospora crassa OR74A]XP_011394086.1 uncharacterized protein NCU04364 [Neurospora crassa OR74A]KHE82324.1 hypothetical protein GE21DRAFT_6159 [Neurospora crassa]ESA42964.1 hypothetical protein NCU04364 [Neurospora crassa OR74A]ESA42965.1 hypothetical protein, variant [Neurospora crassa OR74A]CAF06085.1 related to caffeine-induced death protein 1 Cid1 [Neurospora crassa]|eukprot:XP_011394085.1 hypothetical protein NCU04364 [Neurospora crassa OR74A]